MNQQALDLRRFLRTIWLRRAIVLIAVLAGIAAGTAFGLLRPPVLTARTLVLLPPSATRYTETQVYIADSEPVLTNALRSIEPPLTLAQLRARVTSASLSSNLVAISAKAHTATEAEDIANAVAASYVTYISSPSLPGGQVLGKMLENAPTPTGTSRPVHLITFGLLGGLLGLVIGAIIALARGRGDTRLRSRDEIADAIGIPVLASLPVGHPSDTAGWAVLLSAYQPGVVHAWGMRKALHHLGLTDFRRGDRRLAGGYLAVQRPWRDRPRAAAGDLRRHPGYPHRAGHRPPAGRQRHRQPARRVRGADRAAARVGRRAEDRGRGSAVRRPAAGSRAEHRGHRGRQPGAPDAGDDAHHGQRGRRVGRRGNRRATGPGRRRRGG